MTKVTILGQEPEKKKKPIEFITIIDNYLDIRQAQSRPVEYENIELLAKHWYRDDKLDLMFAFNDDRSVGFLYLGHFNDGVVE